MGTKKKYTGDTTSEEWQAEWRAFRRGTGPEPEYVEVETVEIDTPNGTRVILVDQLPEYEAVIAEMEAAAAEDQEASE